MGTAFRYKLVLLRCFAQEAERNALQGMMPRILFALMGWMWAAQAQTVATVSMSTTPNPSRVSAEVSLTATVTPAGAGGFVSFYDGTALLGSAPVDCWAVVAMGLGSFSLFSDFPEGTVPRPALRAVLGRSPKAPTIWRRAGR